jgi:predicted nucleic acid-binding protein
MTDPARIVLDASVVVKWYLLDEDSPEDALAVRMAFQQGRIAIVLPDVARYEVANALAVARKRGRIDHDKARQAMADFFSWGFACVGTNALILSAMDVAARVDCAVYDALYVALAEALGAPFVTADRALFRKVRPLAACVRWLGDDQPV